MRPKPTILGLLRTPEIHLRTPRPSRTQPHRPPTRPGCLLWPVRRPRAPSVKSRRPTRIFKNLSSSSNVSPRPNPTAPTSNVTFSVAYNRLGNLARDLGQIESAQACFNKSHAIREHLAQSEPGRASLQRDLYVPHVLPRRPRPAFGRR